MEITHQELLEKIEQAYSADEAVLESHFHFNTLEEKDVPIQDLDTMALYIGREVLASLVTVPEDRVVNDLKGYLLSAIHDLENVVEVLEDLEDEQVLIIGFNCAANLS